MKGECGKGQAVEDDGENLSKKQIKRGSGRKRELGLNKREGRGEDYRKERREEQRVRTGRVMFHMLLL